MTYKNDLDFKLIFIVLFLGIISWKGVLYSMGGVCFSDGGVSFLGGGCAMGGIGFGGGVFKKNHKMGGRGVGGAHPSWETLQRVDTVHLTGTH